MERKPATLEQIAIAYLLYYATGEGATVFIALGTSTKHAELHFRSNVPEYFHPGMTVKRWMDSSDELETIKTFVPAQVIDQMTQNPPGTTEHFSVTHWNLS